MAIEYKVGKNKYEEQFKFTYQEDGSDHTELILLTITYAEADILKDMTGNNVDAEKFAEILFKDKLEFVKEKAGSAYEDLVFNVGFQLINVLLNDQKDFLSSMNSMREKIKKT